MKISSFVLFVSTDHTPVKIDMKFASPVQHNRNRAIEKFLLFFSTRTEKFSHRGFPGNHSCGAPTDVH